MYVEHVGVGSSVVLVYDARRVALDGVEEADHLGRRFAARHPVVDIDVVEAFQRARESAVWVGLHVINERHERRLDFSVGGRELNDEPKHVLRIHEFSGLHVRRSTNMPGGVRRVGIGHVGLHDELHGVLMVRVAFAKHAPDAGVQLPAVSFGVVCGRVANQLAKILLILAVHKLHRIAPSPALGGVCAGEEEVHCFLFFLFYIFKCNALVGTFRSYHN